MKQIMKITFKSLKVVGNDIVRYRVHPFRPHLYRFRDLASFRLKSQFRINIVHLYFKLSLIIKGSNTSL